MSPEKRPSDLASIDAGGADLKQLRTPLNHFRWTNTPGTCRLKAQFDGAWLSLRNKNRTKRMETCSISGTGLRARHG